MFSCVVIRLFHSQFMLLTRIYDVVIRSIIIIECYLINKPRGVLRFSLLSQ